MTVANEVQQPPAASKGGAVERERLRMMMLIRRFEERTYQEYTRPGQIHAHVVSLFRLVQVDVGGPGLGRAEVEVSLLGLLHDLVHVARDLPKGRRFSSGGDGHVEAPGCVCDSAQS